MVDFVQVIGDPLAHRIVAARQPPAVVGVQALDADACAADTAGRTMFWLDTGSGELGVALRPVPIVGLGNHVESQIRFGSTDSLQRLQSPDQHRLVRSAQPIERWHGSTVVEHRMVAQNDWAAITSTDCHGELSLGTPAEELGHGLDVVKMALHVLQSLGGVDVGGVAGHGYSGYQFRMGPKQDSCTFVPFGRQAVPDVGTDSHRRATISVEGCNGDWSIDGCHEAPGGGADQGLIADADDHGLVSCGSSMGHGCLKRRRLATRPIGVLHDGHGGREEIGEVVVANNHKHVVDGSGGGCLQRMEQHGTSVELGPQFVGRSMEPTSGTGSQNHGGDGHRVTNCGCLIPARPALESPRGAT